VLGALLLLKNVKMALDWANEPEKTRLAHFFLAFSTRFKAKEARYQQLVYQSTFNSAENRCMKNNLWITAKC